MRGGTGQHSCGLLLGKYEPKQNENNNKTLQSYFLPEYGSVIFIEFSLK